MPDVVFLKVDVDENPDTAAKYNVSAMPTFIFIKGGEGTCGGRDDFFLLTCLLVFHLSPSTVCLFVCFTRKTVIDRLMGANPARLQELIEEHM